MVVEELVFAMRVLLLGFSVVIGTLFLLYFILIIFSRLLYRTGNKAETAAASVYLPEVQTVFAAGIPPQVVAAITAAACWFIRGYNIGSVRVRITPGTSNKPDIGKNWAAVGRKKLLENSLEIQRLRRYRWNEKI